MQFKIDPTTHIPIYLQLINQLKRAITSGELGPQDQLPTVRQLADDLKVNFNTVARAYRMLDEEGIISTQHGRGTYILGDAPKEKSAGLRKQNMSILAQQYLDESTRLGFSSAQALNAIKEHLSKAKQGK
jgi:GntR family transcriptional regulator